MQGTARPIVGNLWLYLVYASALPQQHGYGSEPTSSLSIQSCVLMENFVLKFTVKPLGGYDCVCVLF